MRKKSDFSEGNYACVEENDETLDSFNVDRDKQAVIPMVRDAMKYGKLQIFMSPWSPPAYMKTNGEMNHGGQAETGVSGIMGAVYAMPMHFGLFDEMTADGFSHSGKIIPEPFQIIDLH